MKNVERDLFSGISRRCFMRASGAAALAALCGAEPQLRAANKPEARADSMILLWMAGGMAQTETFDPKRYTEFKPGMASDSVLSTFPSIPTKVDSVRLSKGLERIAGVMDRATLIRSHRVGDLGHILHSRHQYHWHTGYEPPVSVAAPHLGAYIARIAGPRHPDMPPFIDIGQNMEIGAESDALKSFHTAGFLGSEYGPFLIADPMDAASRVRPPAHISRTRFQSRRELYRKMLEGSPIGKEGSGYQRESFLRSMENADRLLSSPAAKAFDLSLEPERSRAQYDTGKFGQSCLLARRLVEGGARFVEVTSEYIPFRFWDTHENGHTRAAGMKQAIDGPVSQLILDLEERGLLDRTLVVLATEFGRDMMVEGKPELPVQEQVKQPEVIHEQKHYGMHRHFTEACSVLIFGGGFRKGLLYGRTAEERPCRIIENPIGIEDLHATLFTAMGIAPDTSFVIEKRPFYVTKDGKGKARTELLAKT